jgi:hypothetical protein
MNCVEFGFHRSRGFGSARGQFWPIAIDRPTRPYIIASTYNVKIGPEVVFGARWRPKVEMMSPLDFPTPILYRMSVEIFRQSLTVQKLFVCVYLAGNLASRFQNLGFHGGFDLEM